MFLVVGLGNPGRRYAATRHNAGFMLVDRLADLGAARFGPAAGKSRVCRVERESGSLILAKPQTYMNLSGVAVRMLLVHYGVDPEELLVVYDEVQLPLGRLRVRRSGSSGGQKGMESIIRMVGTKRIPRLRIGVGGDSVQGNLTDYLLSPFSGDERLVLDSVLDRAVLAVDTISTQGHLRAMDLVNGWRHEDL